jgi:hypothetical protein
VTAAPQTLGDCPRCGLPLPPSARFCPGCGSALDPEAQPPPPEDVAGPMTVQRIESRWLGVPAPLLLLCVGFAALGGAIGLFAAGHWPWGLVLLGLAVLLLGGYSELSLARSELGRRFALLVAGGRERAASAREVWRARLEGMLHQRRALRGLDLIEDERRPLLQELGRAVYAGDAAAEARARAQLGELDERRARVERELEARQAEREERIRRARLPVDETVMVTPSKPSAPYPPPGEGDPPQPAVIPEPYPPPDEGNPPAPEPDPGCEHE